MTKVLVVDDTPDMAQLMAMVVQNEGYEAHVASDGQLALRMASYEHPDVVLLDIMMPQMSGLEVLSHLKADVALREIPVILVSEGVDTSEYEPTLGESLRAIHRKPLSLDELLADIERICR